MDHIGMPGAQLLLTDPQPMDLYVGGVGGSHREEPAAAEALRRALSPQWKGRPHPRRVQRAAGIVRPNSAGVSQEIRANVRGGDPVDRHGPTRILLSDQSARWTTRCLDTRQISPYR